MKRTPVFPPKVFHRIRFTNARELDAVIASSSTALVSDALALPFKRGNGLVVASWDGFGRAEVHALGVVIDVSATGQREVRWVRVHCELPKSDLGGDHFWRQPTFKFAETVANSFRLKELFEKHIPDPFSTSRDTAH